MRVVNDASELEGATSGARREAASAFGDDTITWQGRSIELLAMPTMFQGKQVMGLVCLPILEQGQVPPAQPTQQMDNLAADIERAEHAAGITGATLPY